MCCFEGLWSDDGNTLCMLEKVRGGGVFDNKAHRRQTAESGSAMRRTEAVAQPTVERDEDGKKKVEQRSRATAEARVHVGDGRVRDGQPPAKSTTKDAQIKSASGG